MFPGPVQPGPRLTAHVATAGGSLRPLGAGERIDAAIKIVRRSFLTFMKATMVVAIPVAVVSGVVLLSLSSSFSNLSLDNSGTSTINTRSVQTIFGGFAVLELISLLSVTLITAIAVRIVANTYLGQPTTWKAAVAFGIKRLHSVIWIELLTGLLFAAVGVVFVLAALALSATQSGGAVAVGLLLSLVAGVASVWFFVATSLAVPILMIEDVHGWKAIRRSMSLVRHKWWSTFGTVLLAFVLVLIGSGILRLIIGFALSLLGGGVAALVIESLVVSLLTTLLFASFYAAVSVVITIDLRVRKEGFDIQVLASQMGTSPTSSALSFMPPPHGMPGSYGYQPRPGGFPPQGGGWGYPPPPGGYPPQGGSYGSYPPAPPGQPGAGWQAVAPGWSQQQGWPPPGSPQQVPGWGQQGQPSPPPWQPPPPPPGPGWPQPTQPGQQAPPGWQQQAPPGQPTPPPWPQAGAPQQPPPGWPQPSQGTAPQSPWGERPLPPFRPRSAMPEPPAEPPAESPPASAPDAGATDPASPEPDPGSPGPPADS